MRRLDAETARRLLLRPVADPIQMPGGRVTRQNAGQPRGCVLRELFEQSSQPSGLSRGSALEAPCPACMRIKVDVLVTLAQALFEQEGALAALGYGERALRKVDYLAALQALGKSRLANARRGAVGRW